MLFDESIKHARLRDRLHVTPSSSSANCGSFQGCDFFSSLWRRIFQNATLSQERRFGRDVSDHVHNFCDCCGNNTTLGIVSRRRDVDKSPSTPAKCFFHASFLLGFLPEVDRYSEGLGSFLMLSVTVSGGRNEK